MQMKNANTHSNDHRTYIHNIKHEALLHYQGAVMNIIPYTSSVCPSRLPCEWAKKQEKTPVNCCRWLALPHAHNPQWKHAHTHITRTCTYTYICVQSTHIIPQDITYAAERVLWSEPVRHIRRAVTTCLKAGTKKMLAFTKRKIFRIFRFGAFDIVSRNRWKSSIDTWSTFGMYACI